MEIKLTSEITVKIIQSMGEDAIIAGAAWVSTNGAEALTKAKADPTKVPGLINYVMKHRHGSVFEHSAITFFVHAPIFVWREWHRHRIGFSYNEESGRYKQLDPVFYVPSKDRAMFKVDSWKPGRPKFLTIEQRKELLGSTDNGQTERQYGQLVENLKSSYEHSYRIYEDNLSMGFDPGLARDCLPVGIYSSCWVTCNPRSLMAFLSLRTHDETANHVSYPLHEIEVAARMVEDFLKQGWPITYKAFVDNGREGP
jgi:thymidylate synthase (FAD)